jgi:hypothetical protein
MALEQPVRRMIGDEAVHFRRVIKGAGCRGRSIDFQSNRDGRETWASDRAGRTDRRSLSSAVASQTSSGIGLMRFPPAVPGSTATVRGGVDVTPDGLDRPPGVGLELVAAGADGMSAAIVTIERLGAVVATDATSARRPRRRVRCRA